MFRFRTVPSSISAAGHREITDGASAPALRCAATDGGSIVDHSIRAGKPMRVLSIVRFVLVAAMAGIALPGAIPEAAGADLTVARAISRETAGKRGPIARRGLSKLSTAVLASDGCWRSCTVACGRDLQHCRGTLPFNLCLVGNNRCERLCLQDCRLKGGPLVYPD